VFEIDDDLNWTILWVRGSGETAFGSVEKRCGCAACGVPTVDADVDGAAKDAALQLELDGIDSHDQFTSFSEDDEGAKEYVEQVSAKPQLPRSNPVPDVPDATVVVQRMLEGHLHSMMVAMTSMMEKKLEEKYAPMMKRLDELEKGVSASKSIVSPVVPVVSPVSVPTYVASSTTSVSVSSTVLPVASASHTGEVKPVRLTNLPVYDGKTSYKTWYKQFNVKMRAGGYRRSW
jgi:hypothetical protein